jgi:hypothetical protein
MPSTIIYKQNFPSSTLPVETSATVGSDGLITGSATFVVAATAPYSVGQPISPSLFSSLNGVGIQGLFVDVVSLEKRGGLVLARINVIGAANPVVIQKTVEISTRSFSKTITITSGGTTPVTTAETVDFDYQAETITLSFVALEGENIGTIEERPEIIEPFFNNRGSYPVFGIRRLSRLIPIRKSEFPPKDTRQRQNGIVRVQRVYEVVLQ